MVYCSFVTADRSPGCTGRSFAVHIADNPHIAAAAASAVDCSTGYTVVIDRSPLAAGIAGLAGMMQPRAEKCSLAG